MLLVGIVSIINWLYSKVQTTDKIQQIVLSYGIKCSPDDPVPPTILKGNIDTFVPIWTEIVNLSLSQGSMEWLKSAILLPLIKDSDNLMDKDKLL